MTYFEIEQVRGLQGELQAAGLRLRAMTSGNPAIHNDQFLLAQGQLNSAIHHLELGLLKAEGRAS